MPAINPAHLRIQSAELSEKFSQPESYITALHDLLSQYADRIHRPGQSGEPPPAIDAYHISPPVLGHIERGIREKVQDSPEEGLAIIDALWEEEWLETRLLAAALLGHLPSQRAEEILKRIKAWALSCEEDRLLESILSAGLLPIRDDMGRMIFPFLDELSSLAGPKASKMILFTLKPLVIDDGFQNLPRIFQYLKPLLQEEDETYLTTLIEVIRKLAQRSERETLYFLQHQIPTAPKPKINHIVRQSLQAFSHPSQKALKEAIRHP